MQNAESEIRTHAVTSTTGFQDQRRSPLGYLGSIKEIVLLDYITFSRNQGSVAQAQ